MAVQGLAVEYARPELLIEPAEAAALYAESRRFVPERGMTMILREIVFVDVRSEADYTLSGGLPRATWIDIAEWKSGFGDGTDESAWTKRLRGVVPGADGVVVVYDDAVTPNAARAWWILKYWGASDVRVLNGGVGGWLADGQKLVPPTVPLPTAHEFVAKPNPERHATRAEVLDVATAQAPACLIDTRSDTEVAEGVIPSAAHAEWLRFVDPATGKMRSAEELAALLGEVGFEAEQPAVAYCRSGGRASVVAFAMELMGGREVANYFGSWSNWRSDATMPVGRLPEPALPAETNR